MSKHKVAVYGTLRKGFGNHVLLLNSEFIGQETLSVPYVMHSLGGFPGLVPSDNNHDIVFEIYNVDDKTLRSLDMLEGYSGDEEWDFYSRTTIDTSVGKALVYYLKENDGEIIESGDWYLYKKGTTIEYANEV